MQNLKFSVNYEQQLAAFLSGQISADTKPLILAVDDDEDNLLLLGYILEPLGCSFITAIDGLSALVKAQTYQPDLILLDILLPGMDGTEVTFRLKNDPKTQNIPVIAVTALASDKDQQRILQSGCDDYIRKPYMIYDIEAVVRRHLSLPVTIS
jgi:two-component system cell cycle response regulator DivK